MVERPHASREQDGRSRTDLRIRRRFLRRRWTSRWLRWRGLVAVLLVLVVIGVGVWLVFFSTVLAVQDVKVSGVDYLSTPAVEETAQVPVGEPLARVDLEEIESRVEAMPPVAEAQVTRHWPDAVRIEVTERIAVGAVQFGGAWRGIDETGEMFRDYREPPADLPRLVLPADADDEVRQEAALVAAALPQDVAQITEQVQVETVDQITLSLTAGREVIWGSAGSSEQKGEVLQALLRQKARTYDVSVPSRPTIR